MANDCAGVAILERALISLPSGSLWSRRLLEAVDKATKVGVHLAVFVGPYLEAILDGRKTVESRFTVHRCTPYGRVQRGDIIILKKSGGPVIGLALAGKAEYYELTPSVFNELRSRFARQLFAEDDDFWTLRAEKRFATLIEIDDTVQIDTLAIDKRDRRGWVTYSAGGQQCLALAG
jgi:hypothetical protein